MKISIIGAGNVGSLTAMRIAQENLGDILLIDIVKGLAQAKAFDIEDAQAILKCSYHIQGTEDIEQIKGSDIIVISAGLARKPGMTREQLLDKNIAIIKDICINIKKLALNSILIVVTNPVDLITYFVLKTTGFKPHSVFGMGASLDAARFANFISKELNIPQTDIDACVVGSHGEGMLALPRFTKIKGIGLNEVINDKKIEILIKKTVMRGAEIVSLLNSGSAYFSPSLAVAEVIRVIAKDEKRTLCVSAYIDGQYCIKNMCIGVPCRLGRGGIEKIVELELNKNEKEAFLKSAESIRKNLELVKSYIVKS